MLKTNLKTETYEYENGFMIDIVEKSDLYDVWLYHADYGVKSHMFGLYKKYFVSRDSYKIFLEMIVSNLENQNFIELYKDEYMD